MAAYRLLPSSLPFPNQLFGADVRSVPIDPDGFDLASATDALTLEPCNAGMHLIAWLNDAGLSDRQAVEAIWDSGIDCLPVSIYCDQQALPPGIMFGFACALEDNTATVADCLQTAAGIKVSGQPQRDG